MNKKQANNDLKSEDTFDDERAARMLPKIKGTYRYHKPPASKVGANKSLSIDDTVLSESQ